jgi:Fungal hydrophobin
MQFKLLTTLALAAAAIAVPTGGGSTPAPAPSCETGPIQCCNSVTKASDPVAGVLLGLLGIVLQDLNVLVGVTCSPISVIGLPGNSWLVTRLSGYLLNTYPFFTQLRTDRLLQQQQLQ